MPITQEEAKNLARTLSHAFDAALGKALEQLSQPAGKGLDRPFQKMNDDQKVGIKEIAAAADTGLVPAKGQLDPQTFEAFYQKVKRRLLDECRVDPVLAHILASSGPEFIIDIEPQRLELKEDSLRGRIAILAARGFFATVKTQAETIRELKRTGTEPNSQRVSEAFASMVVDGFMTRESTGFQIAPGAKVTEKLLESR